MSRDTPNLHVARSGRAPVVMHLIDTGGPGGAETVFAELAQRMGTLTKTLAIVPKEGWLTARLRALSIEPVVLAAKGSFNLGYLRRIVGIARKHEVDLIHTHLLGSAVYGALVGLATRKPVLSVMHGPTDVRKPGKVAGVKAWILKRCCARIIAVSTSTRDALVAFGIPRESIVLVQNGVDTVRFSPGRACELRNELGLTPQDLLIGAVGNIRAPKAYEDLVEAAARMLPRHPRCHLAVIGEGSEQALGALRSLATSRGVADRCAFLGFRKGTPELYRNFDLFVSSSRSEGLSLAFLEAMATGLPVVATRSGGPEDVIENEVCGLLAPVSDPDALAAALERVVASGEFRAKLGVAARERVVRGFSFEATFQRYAGLYDDVLGLER